MNRHKLLHAIVAVGAALTGATGTACSSGVDTTAAKDAAADGDYATIHTMGIIMPPPAYDAGAQDAASDAKLDGGEAGLTDAAADGPDACLPSDCHCYPCISPGGPPPDGG
jgi:hypothetical protein